MAKSTASEKRLLIVEDDLGLQKQLRWHFEDYEVEVASDRLAALDVVKKNPPAVVSLDLGLPPDPDGSTEGLSCLEEILAISPSSKVIIVSGNETRENAVKAISSGAYDFYQKPVDPDVLGHIINRAYHVYQLETENQRLLSAQKETPMDGIVASSPQMHSVCQMVEKVAPSDASILILGDSGTGKELCARGLHSKSGYSEGNFIAINCAAIPENLLESELFGYEKGAFTGAAKTTPGKIEYAHNGTLFLDEMGDLPLSLQGKLLRFLQERVVERIGGREEIPVNVRVICATHQKLHEKIEEGSFREDLYYRINEICINMPALNERQGDILLLARSFLDKFNKEQNKRLSGFTREAISTMESYPWPGNVRELRNRVKRAVIMADGKQVTIEDLELKSSDDDKEDLDTFDLRAIRDEAERKAISHALSHVGGKIGPAAELLGVSRPTLYDLMKKLGLKS
ncbi:MAG: PEP-CTERM-box response regulator transcription factor [Gammaproteobacteria bacterium]|nr:PEP-CTERM-box response regulator transcription factor [Gammaproteobacteria bacterium]